MKHILTCVAAAGLMTAAPLVPAKKGFPANAAYTPMHTGTDLDDNGLAKGRVIFSVSKSF